RANGIIFRGVRTFRDDRGGRDLGSNTVFAFELDRIRFVYLGALGHRLTKAQVQEIGRADVLFVSVGNPRLKAVDWHRAAEELKARWIVPVAYRTERSGEAGGLSLDEVDLKDYPFKKVADSRFLFSRDGLPEKPTLLLLESP
ncbi:MAG: MBL fold metallo-hydrolase, partial [Verrucomicrobiia bacterium]